MAHMRTHPVDVQFDTAGKAVIPACARRRGLPYTGEAGGIDDIVQWGGCFAEGVPHGAFHIRWGDRVTSRVWLRHGVELGGPEGGR